MDRKLKRFDPAGRYDDCVYHAGGDAIWVNDLEAVLRKLATRMLAKRSMYSVRDVCLEIAAECGIDLSVHA